jgi:hypothetical protein
MRAVVVRLSFTPAKRWDRLADGWLVPDDEYAPALLRCQARTYDILWFEFG